MKKANKLVTFVTIAALSFGSAISVFADEATAGAGTQSVAASYENLKYTEKNWYFENKDCGVYPVIAGMDDLNAKIEDYIWKSSILKADQEIKLVISYEVTDNDRFASLALKFDYQYATMFKGSDSETVKYFVDKETMKEITEDEFNKGLAEATEAPAPVAPIADTEAAATEAAEEEESVDMLGVREYCETLGLTLGWNDESKSVTVASGDVVIASFKVDVNAYVFGDETVELESAPVNQDGTVFVPISFFECLGATVNYAEDGSVKSIVLPEQEATEAAATEEATPAEEATEEEATEEEATEDEAVEDEAAEDEVADEEAADEE